MDDDLPGRLGKGLARCASGDGAVCVQAGIGQRLLRLNLVIAMAGAQFAPHLTADPEQEDATGQEQAGDGDKLGCDQSEADAQHRGGDDADRDGLGALVLRQARRGTADDPRVVAGQDQVDGDDLKKHRKAFGGEDFRGPGPSWQVARRHTCAAAGQT